MNIYQVPLPVLDHGSVFRGRRNQLDLTLKELSLRAGVGEGAIRKLERHGRIGFQKLRQLAPHLQLTDEQALVLMSIQQRVAEERSGP